MAGTIAASGAGTERPAGNANEADFCIPEVAGTIRSGSDSPAAHNKVNGTDRETLIAFDDQRGRANAGISFDQARTIHSAKGPSEVQLIAHTLRAEGHDANEDGTGRGVPLVCSTISGVSNGGGANGPGRTADDADTLVPVAFDMRGREGGAQFEGPHDTANVRASSGGSSRSYVAGMSVRRLTPREVERLMGFPDDFTLVPYRGKPACDGPRYRALGNSMAVPVIAWLGKRIELVEGVERTRNALSRRAP